MSLVILGVLLIGVIALVAYPLWNTPKMEAAAVSSAVAGRACPTCGAGYDAGDRFCVRCGAPLPAPKGTAACLSCGAPLGPDDTFCSVCGSAAGEAGRG
jgi:predicted amidophosphoribosyltransferase